MRFFIVAFTSMYKTMKNPKKWFFKKATCYANRSQVRQMRAIITKIITKECKASTMKDLVYKVLGNEITEEMAKKCKPIFPLENITIRKVKSIKRPKVDINQLNEMHAAVEGEKLAGVKVQKKNNKKLVNKIIKLNINISI